MAPSRQHPAWIFLSAVQQLRGLAIPLLVLLVGGGRRGEGWFLGVGALLVLFGLVARGLAWWQFRYEVSERELRVRSGLLAKQERVVPLERVQAVDIDETPLQRLFGVVGVRVETAAGGAGAPDVSLQAVTRTEAERLRQLLVAARRPAAAPTPDVADPGLPDAALGRPVPFGAQGELIRRLSGGELLAAGATSGRIGPALAIFGVAFQLLDDVLPEDSWERVVTFVPGWSIRGAVAIALVVGVGAWLLAIGSTVLTFGGFELRRDGERLLVAHGLLDRRRRSIPLGRIQAVSAQEGLLRRPFGLAALRFESAGYGQDRAESGILWPLLRRDQVDDLLRRAVPGYAAPLVAGGAEFAGPPPRARVRYLMADVWPLLGTALLALAASILLPRWLEATFTGVRDPLPWLRPWWGLVPLALVPVALLQGAVRWRETGWRLDSAGRLVVRNGGLVRVTTVVPRRRLQRRWVDQNPLQRRSDLASFGGAIASGLTGGRLGLDHLDAGQAFELLARLGPDPSPEPGALLAETEGEVPDAQPHTAERP